jgi:hypothetical protein
MDIRFRRSMDCADVEPTAHARRCLQLRMQPCGDRLAHVEVALGDAGDSRAWQDSYCIVRVKLHGVPAATVVDVDADVYRAIDRAADRAWRVTREQLRLAASAPTTPTDALAA